MRTVPRATFPRKKIKPAVVFIVGPTASGKSALAVALAKKLNGEVVSADSMLIYQGMDIGTAKPSRKERGGIPHHCIDLIPPTRSFSVFAYRQAALKAIKAIVRRGKLPVIAGGTGFYVRALLDGLTPQPGANAALRRQLEQEAQEKGLPTLLARLRQIDPVRAETIDPHNGRRIIRALEIALCLERKPSPQKGKSPGLEALGYQPVVVGLHRDREALYQKINRRVDAMFRKGLVREVKRFGRKKVSETALQGVGYKEVIAALKRQDVSQKVAFMEARDRIKQTTRHFAKRQWTWFKREGGIRWVWWPEGAKLTTVRDFIVAEMLGTKYAAR